MRTSIFVLLLIITTCTSAQTQLAFRSGINFANIVLLTDGGKTDAERDPVILPHFGLTFSKQLGEKFYFGPEVLFSMQGFNTDQFCFSGFKTKYRFSYLSTPLVLGYQATKKMNIQLGPAFEFLLLAGRDSGKHTNPIPNNSDFKKAFKKVILSVNLGTDFAISEKGRIGVRYSGSLTRLMDRNNLNPHGACFVPDLFSDFKNRSRIIQIYFAFKL